MAEGTQAIPQLELEAAVGFNGHVPSGLRVHPDREHLIYPLGCTIILRRIADGNQEFLHGHTNKISCISVSKSGSYIASGQVNSMGFEAPVIIWSYAQRALYAQLQLHKTKVEALAFSPNDMYLVSLGGQDDGRIIVWDIETKRAICGTPASAGGHCATVEYSNTDDNIFVSAGSETLRIWKLDLTNKKVRPTECRTGLLKRSVKCIQISEDDEFIFCGTTSGDLLKIHLKTGILKECGPPKAKYSQGVNVLKLLKSGDLLVGSGSGALALCSKTNFKALKKANLEKTVTSIAVEGEGQHFFVGTQAAQMYYFNYENFEAKLMSTSHSHAVNDVAIPFGTSEIFATCSHEDIRLWHTEGPKELLRITVPNVTCNCLDFMLDGLSIISGWSDNKICVFGPENGHLMLTITDAHKMGVTAITGTRDCKRIVSGGGNGQIRVWDLLSRGYRLLESMKEHKAAISCIQVKSDDKECVSVSTDGSCVIWDLVRFVSLKLMMANTMFRTVCYHPEEFQIITSGTDKTIMYWELFDGSAIGKLEGSQFGAINSLHITQDGQYFVSGGEEKLVKVWEYVKGVVTHVGAGHGGSITKVKICPNSHVMISTSTDGAILRWKFPHPPPTPHPS